MEEFDGEEGERGGKDGEEIANDADRLVGGEIGSHQGREGERVLRVGW